MPRLVLQVKCLLSLRLACWSVLHDSSLWGWGGGSGNLACARNKDLSLVSGAGEVFMLTILPGSWQERTGGGLRSTLSVLRLSLIVGLVQNFMEPCLC